MHRFILWIISGIALFYSMQVHAQIDPQFSENIIAASDTNTGKVMLSVNNTNYFRNYEYMSPIQYGYTLFGSQLNTQVAFQPQPYMRVQAGVFLQQEFGASGLQTVAPVLTMKFFKKGYSFLFGALEGNIAHRLYEPLYNYERLITHPIENGFQFKSARKRSWSDTWVQWEYRQRAGVMEQERLTAGHSSEWQVVSKPRWQFIVKPQGLIHHRGGQLSPIKMTVQSLLQAAIGARLQFKELGIVRSWWIEPAYFYYKDLSNTNELPYNNGTGLFVNAGVQTKWPVSISAGYWQGNQFLSRSGNPLFASQASLLGKPGYLEPKRELLFLRALYQQHLSNNLHVDIRFEPYYDLGQQRLEYAYSLFLVYKFDVRLAQLYPSIQGKRPKPIRP